MYCNNCGNEVQNSEAVFCSHCGKKFESVSNLKLLVNEKTVTTRFDFSDIFVFITIFIGVIIFILSFCPWVSSDEIFRPESHMYWTSSSKYSKDYSYFEEYYKWGYDEENKEEFFWISYFIFGFSYLLLIASVENIILIKKKYKIYTLLFSIGIFASTLIFRSAVADWRNSYHDDMVLTSIPYIVFALSIISIICSALAISTSKEKRISK